MQIASKITSKGQVTVPCAIRNEFGIYPGDTVFFEAKGGVIQMRKPKNLMDYVGLLGKVGLPAREEGMITPEVATRILERNE